MKQVICYQLDDNSLYLNYEDALEAEQFLKNRIILNNTQNVPLKFKVNDIVYFIYDDLINRCKVEDIEENIYHYSEYEDNKITEITLKNILTNDIYFPSTSSNCRDLNTIIKLIPQDFFNFTVNNS